MRDVLAGLLVFGALAAQAPADKPSAPGAQLPPVRSPEPAMPGSVSGAHTFRAHCAGCHGEDGRGDGPLADGLQFHPANLTLLARRNGGAFPFEKVVRIVDGRQPVKGHGGPDMPIWGDAFKNSDTGYDERLVQEKIRQVVEYLRTLQQK